MPGAENISRRWKRSGPAGMPFCKLDILHRRNLERILPRFGIADVPEKRSRQSQSGLASARRMAGFRARPARGCKTKFVIAPVSNGNISLMVDLARRNGFPWDAILGAEIAGDFKPKPRVYLAACEALDLAPAECMMVAAHSSDLSAAAACGLRTGHIARPNENGPGRGEKAPSVPVDIAARDLEDFAGTDSVVVSRRAIS